MVVDRNSGTDNRAENTEPHELRDRPPAPPPDRPGSPGFPSRLESLRDAREAQVAAAAEEDPGQEGPQDSGTEADVVGSIDESEKAFHSAERRIAELLKSEGSTVRALRESPQHGVRTPDAIVDGTPTEFKSLREGAGSNTVKNALNSAKGQADHAIVDARGSGLEQPTAQLGLN